MELSILRDLNNYISCFKNNHMAGTIYFVTKTWYLLKFSIRMGKKGYIRDFGMAWLYTDWLA